MYLEAAGLFLSIVTVVILIRRGFTLFWALLAGTALISAFSLLKPKEIVSIVAATTASPVTIFLILMVTAITIMGYSLEKTGTLQKMVDSMYQIITDARYLSALLPAVISFLAIPGGAIISAPMVEKAAGELNLSGVRLSLINLLFRHLFVLISPFYPAIIFMASVTERSIFSFIAFAFPAFFVSLVFSFFYVFRDVARSPSKAVTGDLWLRVIDLLKSFSPFFLVFLFYLGFNVYLPLAMFLGVIYTLFLYLPKGKDSIRVLQERIKYLYRGIGWKMVATSYAIMIYKNFIENASSLDSGVHFILDRGFPLFLLLIILPYVTSVMIGNSIASLGIVLPILLPALGEGSGQMAYLGIIYIASHVGYLGSPTHLCTYLSAEYFKVPIFRVVLEMNLTAIPTLLVALVVSLLY